MMKKYLIPVAAAAALLSACETPTSGQVAVTDLSASNTVIRTSAKELTIVDIRNMSGRIVDKIFLDDGFLARAERDGFSYGEIPFAVRNVENFTGSDIISTDDFLAVIEEHLLNSQATSVYTADSPDWFYALDADLTSSSQSASGGGGQTIYKLTVTMTSIENQKIGIWSEDIALTK